MYVHRSFKMRILKTVRSITNLFSLYIINSEFSKVDIYIIINNISTPVGRDSYDSLVRYAKRLHPICSSQYVRYSAREKWKAFIIKESASVMTLSIIQQPSSVLHSSLTSHGVFHG